MKFPNIKYKTMVSRDKIPSEFVSFYDKGYEEGPKSRQHADKFIQERWNKWVVFAKEPIDYFAFMAWECGYWTSRRDCAWGLGKFDEYADDDYGN